MTAGRTSAISGSCRRGGPDATGPPRNPSVELPCDAKEDALDAVVEVVEDGAASPHGVGVVLPWGLGESSPRAVRLDSSDSTSAASLRATISSSFTARPRLR